MTGPDPAGARSARQSPDCEVAVVGAGPAGLSAATELAQRGLDVLVLERHAEAGGIPRHCGHPPFGMREFGRVLRGPEYAKRLVARAEKAGVRFLRPASVVAVRPGGALVVTSDAGVAHLSARAVLLATGVRETTRAGRLIGGTKPAGVLNTGALQALVYLAKQAPFRRPVILGSELVSFSALLTCRHAGIRPAAMVEPGPRPLAWRASTLLPRVLGVACHFGTRVEAVSGTHRVQGVVLRTGDRTWELAADGLIVTGGFVPEAGLIEASHLAVDAATGGPVVDAFGRCSDPAYFAAGNLLRPVETAGWSWAEGKAVGRAIAQALRSGLPDPSDAIDLVAEGAALRYLMPQRLTPASAAGLQAPQLRVARPVAGTLSLRHEGRELWRQRLRALPERRIVVPLDALRRAAAHAGSPARLTVRLEETAS
jgi:thioredoxin reductase